MLFGTANYIPAKEFHHQLRAGIPRNGRRVADTAGETATGAVSLTPCVQFERILVELTATEEQDNEP